jgi:hypothetical protein
MIEQHEAVTHCLQAGLRMSNLMVFDATSGSIERFGSRGHRPTI